MFERVKEQPHPEAAQNNGCVEYDMTAPAAAADRNVLFELFVSRLDEFLAEYKSTVAISDHFGIHPEQAEAWLRRALGNGKVVFHETLGWKCLK
jgi:hypothetical protein